MYLAPAISYTVVIPFFNECENVHALLSELLVVEKEQKASWNFVLVSDGGTDGTPAALDAWSAEHPRCKVLHMPGNRGQAASLYAGLQQATTPFIITMDGDGQNVPRDIPELIRQLGPADMVVGIRTERNDSRLRRLMSRLANRVRGHVLGDLLSDSGCALKVFRREVVQALLPIRTLYSFMPAMAVAAGFTVRQYPVQHRSRRAGRSSYGLRAFLWRPLMDMLGLLWFRQRCLPLRQILACKTQ
jgi:glycosyltransferase involved in cell wall biosynthesis